MTMKLKVDMLDGAMDGLQVLAVGHNDFAARGMKAQTGMTLSTKTAAPKAALKFNTPGL